MAGRAAADEATRGAVRSMIEAGLDADSAGLARGAARDGSIVFTENRSAAAVLAERPRSETAAEDAADLDGDSKV